MHPSPARTAPIILKKKKTKNARGDEESQRFVLHPFQIKQRVSGELGKLKRNWTGTCDFSNRAHKKPPCAQTFRFSVTFENSGGMAASPGRVYAAGSSELLGQRSSRPSGARSAAVGAGGLTGTTLKALWPFPAQPGGVTRTRKPFHNLQTDRGKLQISCVPPSPLTGPGLTDPPLLLPSPQPPPSESRTAGAHGAERAHPPLQPPQVSCATSRVASHPQSRNC